MIEKQNITMKDIARELGVSVATVSRALKDSPRISEEQRERIKQYAHDHNFYPNVLAKSLRHSRVAPLKVIGVIIPQIAHYYDDALTQVDLEIKEGYTCTKDDVEEYCLKLPRYKRPREIIFAHVPRNATGKIEKPRLREEYGAANLVAAENQIES